MDDIEKAVRVIEQWHLGQTSAKHETGGRGPATISTGRGDHGGVSYGTYQLSSKMEVVQKYLSESRYKNDFAELIPTTQAFDAKWRELATTDPRFAQDQHDFIRRTHYDLQVAKLRHAGIDLSGRGRAVQDALWSTSVQYGGGTDAFQRGLEEKFGNNYDLTTLSDRDIVEAVQDYKISHVKKLFESSPDLRGNLLKRAREEKAELIELAVREELLTRNDIHISIDLSAGIIDQTAEKRNIGHRSTPYASNQQLQQALNILGYTDARGHTLEVDGHYGKHTREAVASFQRHQGLIADGIAGPNTWAALQEATRVASIAPTMAPATTVEPPVVTFPQMAPPSDLDASAIRTLQQHLNTLHLADHRNQAVSITGIYDEDTRTAVAEFQQTQGLPGTGLADPATRGLIEARATIAELQQNTNMHAIPMREAPLLDVSTQTLSTSPIITQSQPSVSPASSEAMSALAIHHAVAPNQDPFAAIQAQLREMQRQMEAMNHQREQERTKEREQDHACTAPYEPAPHAAHPSREAPTVDGMGHDAPDTTQKAPGLPGTDGIDPRRANHPLNGLYNELKTRIPDASEKRLLQFTAACHTHHITAENLGRIDLHGQGDYIRFCPSWPPGPVATVDLKTPAPEPQQCMAHIQQHDQQQVQLMAQIQAQVALTNAQGMQGPVLGGPSR